MRDIGGMWGNSQYVGDDEDEKQSKGGVTFDAWSKGDVRRDHKSSLVPRVFERNER